jgi:hypothetical protein
MQQKIILFIIFLFVAGSAWLFHSSNRFLDPNIGKNWWSIEFVDPKSESLNLTLKNHSDISEFKMIVFQEEERILEENINLPKGEEKNIDLDEKSNIKKENRIRIEINAGDEKKEIYKNF